MIRVFNIPAVTCTLTAALLVSGSYHLLQATRSHHLTDVVNKSLHALMNVLIVAMLWNLVPSTLLAQIAVLTGAALWFVIQAVARPEFKILCAGSQGRLTCAYHSLTMAGGALMIAMMVPAAAAGNETAGATGVPMAHGHHAPATPGGAASVLDSITGLGIPLTIFFGTAAVVFFILFLTGRAARTMTHGRATGMHSVHAERGHEALGAAVMAMMFATMAA